MRTSRKRGFILAYSVTMMAFILLLISAIISLAQYSATSGNILVREFDRRNRLDQIGEYFLGGRKDDCYSIAEKEGFLIKIQNDDYGNAYLRVKDEKDQPLLYVALDAEKTVCWLYGNDRRVYYYGIIQSFLCREIGQMHSFAESGGYGLYYVENDGTEYVRVFDGSEFVLFFERNGDFLYRAEGDCIRSDREYLWQNFEIAAILAETDQARTITEIFMETLKNNMNLTPETHTDPDTGSITFLLYYDKNDHVTEEANATQTLAVTVTDTAVTSVIAPLPTD